MPADENKLIQFLQNRYRAKSGLLKKGIGDDAAVIAPEKAGEYWLITTDMLLEKIDFRLEWTTPKLLGGKAISVNLSDLAAMGARPRFFTIALAIPKKISQCWIRDFYDGISEYAQGAQLIGGDLSRTESDISISVTAFGESMNKKVLYRSGGNPGDVLYVTGILGKSGAGLRLLQSGEGRSRSRKKQDAMRTHNLAHARCEVGMWLAQSGLVNCMMDLSDGLSTDLPRLCAASRVGAEIEAADLPVFADAAEWGLDPTDLALNGGEDYELLFSVPKSKQPFFEKQYPKKFPQLTRIGAFTPDKGRILLKNKDQKPRKLIALGFDHFR